MEIDKIMSEQNSRNVERIDLLDYARFIAALAVVMFHYSYIGVRDGHLPSITFLPGFTDIGKYGYLGVELFFMISGFVIFNSAKSRTAAQFAVARALRLYPAFVVCMILTSCAIFFWGGPLNRITPVQFLANLSMLQALFGQKNVDGSYWTLAVEMKFYAAILFLMLIGFSKRLEYFFLAWPILMLTASLLGFQPVPFLKGYDSYFCAGALFAMKRSRKSVLLNTLLFVCFSYSVQLSAITHFEPRDLYPLSQFVIASIVAAFYLFFWILSSDTVSSLKLPLSRQVGVVTYPLYLVHQTIGYIIIRHFGNEQNKFYAVITTMVAMVCLGFFLHFYAEKKPEKFWKLVFKRTIGTFVIWLEAHVTSIRLKFKPSV